MGLASDKWKKKSFSQCGEDLIIKFLFDTIGIANPSYMDIGAHHPYYLSNTAIFYEDGSKGINIEPDPLLFKEFLKERKRDINLNVGIAELNGELDFYIINVPTLNTFSKEEAEKYSQEGNYFIKEVKKVSVLNVSTILNRYFSGKFPHFLTLDAEGIDELVLNSIDYSENFPIVICVETISFSNQGVGVKNKELVSFLEDKGYLFYADTYINSLFIRKEHWIKK